MSKMPKQKYAALVKAGGKIKIATIALVTALAAPAIAAPPLKVGDRAVSTQAYACRDINVMAKFLELMPQDMLAAGKLLADHQVDRSCLILHEGNEVTLEDWSFIHNYLVCVRPHGEPYCYWTRRDELFKTPEDWQKWKAQRDAEDEADRKETARIHDMSNDAFDRVHPECKDFRTNKNLPEYCY